ncbi:MAG: STAS domain-containing protein [Spirochaetota bacterium]
MGDKNDSLPVKKLGGELTIYRAGEIRDFLAECISAENGCVIDLGGAGTVDTCVMQLFIAAKKTAAGQGRILRLENHPRDFIRMIDLYGLIGLFGDPLHLRSDLKAELSLSYGIRRERGAL